MNLREEGKERRRQRILDAVVDVLCGEGLAGLTVAKIARQARVSVATLYNLIGPLDEIVAAMIERRFEEFEAIRLEPGSDEDSISAIYRFVDAMTDHLREGPRQSQAIHRAIYQLNMAHGLSKTVVRTAQRQQQSFRAHIEDLAQSGLLRREVKPARLAEQMLTGQMSLLQAWAIGVISLDRFQVSCRLLFATLLRAWTTPTLASRLDRDIREMDSAIELQDESTGRVTRRFAL